MRRCQPNCNLCWIGWKRSEATVSKTGNTSNEPAVPRPSPALADLFIPERAAEIAFWTDLAMGYGRVVINWHCGTGELALGLAQNGLKVVGVDPDIEAIEVARLREAALNKDMLLTCLCHEPRLISL